MSISSEITLLNNTKQAIKTSINAKGGNITNSTPFADYSTAIDNLPSGGDNSTLIDLIERDITNINIPSGTTSIGNYAFYNCSSLTSVTIPNGVTTIGISAFQGCNGLTSINIPNGVTTIGENAFYLCRNIISIDMPNSISSIDGYAFWGCTGLTSIDIPNSVTSIGNNAFSGCNGLTSLTLGNSISTIGENAFKQCSRLTSLVIPDSITRINYAAFEQCTSLNYIVCLKDTPPSIGGAFGNTNNCPIYVPAESVDAYKAASVWSIYASRIFAIQQVATVDGNPVYNYNLGMTSTTMITSTNMQKMPTGTSLELAEGIVDAGGSFGNYTSITLPSTFSSFDDQGMIGNTTTTLTCLATTPPTAERNDIGGANLTAIYVPAASVSDYQADAAWSGFSSIIQAISA